MFFISPLSKSDIKLCHEESQLDQWGCQFLVWPKHSELEYYNVTVDTRVFRYSNNVEHAAKAYEIWLSLNQFLLHGSFYTNGAL